MSEPRNGVPLILTGVASVFVTVGCLWYYGYVHFAKPQDARLLAEFTMLKTIPGESYQASAAPARQVAQCVDGRLVLFDQEQRGLSGVLVDEQGRLVRCLL